jgi:hypothetical protein
MPEDEKYRATNIVCVKYDERRRSFTYTGFRLTDPRGSVIAALLASRPNLNGIQSHVSITATTRPQLDQSRPLLSLVARRLAGARSAGVRSYGLSLVAQPAPTDFTCSSGSPHS